MESDILQHIFRLHVNREPVESEDMLQNELGTFLGGRQLGQRDKGGRLTDAVNHSHDDSVAIGCREPGDEV